MKYGIVNIVAVLVVHTGQAVPGSGCHGCAAAALCLMMESGHDWVPMGFRVASHET